MAKIFSRFFLARRWITLKNYYLDLLQLITYYKRMLGDIYYWQPAEKGLLISVVALAINIVITGIEIVVYVIKPENLQMSHENLGWAIVVTSFNVFLLSISCALCFLFRSKDKYQHYTLVFALSCLVISLALLTGTIGFFDSVTWQLFFLFNASLIVFLDRKWVMSSFLSLLMIMIWMTFNDDLLPFSVRAIRLAPEMQISDIGFMGLIFQWSLLLWIGGFGIVMIDFFLSSWRNRDTDLRSKSYIDELTQLLNRRATLEGLAEEYRRSVRVAYPISVGIIDLDFFKSVNDRFGHPFGDIVLKEVAKEIASIGRKNDLVGRYGGEEFVIVFPECNAKIATSILERLREKVQALIFTAPTGEKISVTISAGVAQREEADEEYLQLIARADFALYRAKEFGRNQVLSVEIEDNEQLAFLDRI
jgi:diguanylate cyclase (GGDEF)-like protein